MRRLAAEHSLDVDRVAGTGMGGRVTRNDVLRYLEQQTATVATTVPTTPPSIPAPVPAAAVAPATPAADEERVALTPVRRMIADAMVRSVTQIPHAWSMVEVDITNLVGLRSRERDRFRAREGVNLTYLPFALKAVASTLKDNPTMNASWGDDCIILKRRINLGIAVAAPTGLVVPVIHDADRLSISGLAHAVADLSERARGGTLRLEDVQGGTFTVNNTGALGSVLGGPIINHPQAGILTTEAVQQRPVVINDAIAIRWMMNLCLSFDHRINDGAESGAFMQSVKSSPRGDGWRHAHLLTARTSRRVREPAASYGPASWTTARRGTGRSASPTASEQEPSPKPCCSSNIPTPTPGAGWPPTATCCWTRQPWPLAASPSSKPTAAA